MRLLPQLATWSLVLLAVAAEISCTMKPPPASPAGSDTEESLALAAATSAFDRGDIALARTQYRQALLRARAINSPVLIADAAYDLAVCDVITDQCDEAMILLQEAEYDATRAGADVSDIILLRAKAAYGQGNLTLAEEMAAKIVVAHKSDGASVQAEILKGRISCDKGDITSAESQASRVAQLITSGRGGVSASIRADAARLDGLISRQNKNDLAAAGSFDRESDLLREAKRYRDMSMAISRAADAYMSADKPALAADRYFLAARSFAAQGDFPAARRLLPSSISAADKAGDRNTRERAAALLGTLNEPTSP